MKVAEDNLSIEMREALEKMAPVAEQAGVTPEELIEALQTLCEIMEG